MQKLLKFCIRCFFPVIVSDAWTRYFSTFLSLVFRFWLTSKIPANDGEFYSAPKYKKECFCGKPFTGGSHRVSSTHSVNNHCSSLMAVYPFVTGNFHHGIGLTQLACSLCSDLFLYHKCILYHATISLVHHGQLLASLAKAQTQYPCIRMQRNLGFQTQWWCQWFGIVDSFLRVPDVSWERKLKTRLNATTSSRRQNHHQPPFLCPAIFNLSVLEATTIKPSRGGGPTYQ